MGFSHVCACLCLQGGGVAVLGGTVSFSSCTITGNTATSVRAQNFPSPDGKIADALAPTHACTTANASVNYRMYVLQRPCKLPIAPMGKCLVDMSISILIFDSWCYLDLPACSTCHLRLKLQKFPLPRWETHILLVVCRAAVSSSRAAQ